ncbi:hypothetical protein BASA82_000059 [Batrachochytrium salamandrivorans]|nr:hypothetical protein BASA82_000059 [Batrachochytrium salamandrivorans]
MTSPWRKVKELVWESTMAEEFWQAPTLGSLLKPAKLAKQNGGAALENFCANAKFLFLLVLNPDSLNKLELNALVAAHHSHRASKGFEVATMGSFVQDADEERIDQLDLPWPRVDVPTGRTSYQHFNKRALLRLLHVHLGETKLAVIDLETYALVCHNALPKLLSDQPLDHFPFYDCARIELLSTETLPPPSHRRKYPDAKFVVVVFAGEKQQLVYDALAPLVKQWDKPEKLVLVAGTCKLARKYWSMCGGRFGRRNEMDNGPVLVLIDVDGDASKGENEEDVLYFANTKVFAVAQVDEQAVWTTSNQTRSCTQNGRLQRMCRPGDCYERHGLQLKEICGTYCHVCQVQQRLDPVYYACEECAYRECGKCHLYAVATNATEDQM